MKGVNEREGRAFVTIALTDPRDIERLKVYMEKEDRTASWVGRRALKEFLDRQEHNDD